MDLTDNVRKVKEDSFIMASLPEETRNGALDAVTRALDKNKTAIFDANKLDMEAAKQNALPDPIISRLKFDQQKLNGCIAGINDLTDLDDPLFKELLKRELDNDLVLTKQHALSVLSVLFLNPDLMLLYRLHPFVSKAATASYLKAAAKLETPTASSLI